MATKFENWMETTNKFPVYLLHSKLFFTRFYSYLLACSLFLLNRMANVGDAAMEVEALL